MLSHLQEFVLVVKLQKLIGYQILTDTINGKKITCLKNHSGPADAYGVVVNMFDFHRSDQGS